MVEFSDKIKYRNIYTFATSDKIKHRNTYTFATSSKSKTKGKILSIKQTCKSYGKSFHCNSFYRLDIPTTKIYAVLIFSPVHSHSETFIQQLLPKTSEKARIYVESLIPDNIFDNKTIPKTVEIRGSLIDYLAKEEIESLEKIQQYIGMNYVALLVWKKNLAIELFLSIKKFFIFLMKQKTWIFLFQMLKMFFSFLSRNF